MRLKYERVLFMKSRQVSAKTNVVCDVCGENILLETSKLKSKHFPDGIHIDYFSCGHCGAKFVYLVTDPALRKDIQRKAEPLPMPLGTRSSAVSFHSVSHKLCTCSCLPTSSAPHMKARALELKLAYADRVKELP